MVLDFTLTLAGQPSSYWKDPSQAQEFNALAASAMHRGPAAILAGWSVYAAAAVALTFLPRLFGAIAAMTFALAHFCAASGWIIYRFHLGMTGLYLFSLLVGATIIFVVSDRAAKRALKVPEPATPSGPSSP
jgi:uncharacterized membrane protein YphA (DoxX/SURF4 family)